MLHLSSNLIAQHVPALPGFPYSVLITSKGSFVGFRQAERRSPNQTLAPNVQGKITIITLLSSGQMLRGPTFISVQQQQILRMLYHLRQSHPPALVALTLIH